MTAPGPTTLTIRPASPADLPFLSAAADAIFLEPRGIQDSMARRYPLLFDPQNAENLILATRGPLGAGAGDPGTEIVGHAGFCVRDAVVGEATFPVALFGAVFTSPDLRGQGLGKRLVDDARAYAQRKGAAMGLVSGAGPLYTRAGFTALPEFTGFRAERHRLDAVSPRPGIDVVRFAPAALRAVMSLYLAEDARFDRSESDWQRLLDAAVLFYDPGELWLIREGGRLSSAVAVARRPPEVQGAGSVLRALEILGDRASFVAALPRLMASASASVIDIVVPAHDRALRAALAGEGFPRHDLDLSLSVAAWTDTARQYAAPFPGWNYL